MKELERLLNNKEAVKLLRELQEIKMYLDGNFYNDNVVKEKEEELKRGLEKLEKIMKGDE